jgi:hypothetical protein
VDGEPHADVHSDRYGNVNGDRDRDQYADGNPYRVMDANAARNRDRYPWST